MTLNLSIMRIKKVHGLAFVRWASELKWMNVIIYDVMRYIGWRKMNDYMPHEEDIGRNTEYTIVHCTVLWEFLAPGHVRLRIIFKVKVKVQKERTMQQQRTSHSKNRKLDRKSLVSDYPWSSVLYNEEEGRKRSDEDGYLACRSAWGSDGIHNSLTWQVFEVMDYRRMDGCTIW